MYFCTRCVYPIEHPLGIDFDSVGVCTGCRIHEEKDQLDWSVHEAKLRNILDTYRCSEEAQYDCVVPISGGKDSFFIVDLLKNKYNLTPLLVMFNRHYNTRAGIYNAERLRTVIGCEIMTLTLDPRVYKKLIRYTLEKLGSIHWPYLAGSTVFPVQVAVNYKIPLIIWGAHQGIDQVGMFSHLDEVEMTRRYRKEHDLMKTEAEDILDQSKVFEKYELSSLFYPNDEELDEVGVRGIYLNNYIRWDTKAQHEKMLSKYHYFTGFQEKTFDAYNDVDCAIYSSLHDEIKFRKHGYGKVTDHVCREIRLGRLTREQGIDLVNKYNKLSIKSTRGFADWMGLSEEKFWELIEEHTTSKIWVNSDRQHIFQKENSINIEKARLSTKNKEADFNFIHNHPIDLGEDPYTLQLLMRGYASYDTGHTT